MAISQSKIWYEPCSLEIFEALEQTCRLRPLTGSKDKYLFSHLLAAQVNSLATVLSRCNFETAVNEPRW